jgi:hypothetical protein
MTPVIFRWYARSLRTFSTDASFAGRCAALANQFESVAGASVDEPFGFFCRVGVSSQPDSRSLRLDLSELMRD